MTTDDLKPGDDWWAPIREVLNAPVAPAKLWCGGCQKMHDPQNVKLGTNHHGVPVLCCDGCLARIGLTKATRLQTQPNRK